VSRKKNYNKPKAPESKDPNIKTPLMQVVSLYRRQFGQHRPVKTIRGDQFDAFVRQLSIAGFTPKWYARQLARCATTHPTVLQMHEDGELTFDQVNRFRSLTDAQQEDIVARFKRGTDPSVIPDLHAPRLSADAAVRQLIASYESRQDALHVNVIPVTEAEMVAFKSFAARVSYLANHVLKCSEKPVTANKTPGRVRA